jgi:benzoate-CoA ligase family protein
MGWLIAPGFARVEDFCMSIVELPERLNAAREFVDVHLARGRADKPAILCGDRVMTYQQLFDDVNRFGNVLTALDVRMEERVALLLPDSPEWVSSFFGAMKVGAVALPLNTNLKAADYLYFLNDSRARVLVVDPSLLEPIQAIASQLTYLKQILVVGDNPHGHLSLGAVMAAAAPDLEPADTSKDDMAFWLYSSGTTGSPKAAIHLHHDMIVAADLYAKATIGLREADVSYSVAKLFFAFGLGNGLYFPLRVGGTTVLLPGRPTPDAAFAMIDDHQPTVFYSVPTCYAAMLHEAEKTGRTSLGRVRMCVSAGETLPAHLFQTWRDRFGIEILDGIGSTEILHIFISNRPGHAKPGSTGQIVPGYEAKIVDEDGRELPPGSVGTLWIKGDSIAAGYWNKHEQTKQTFCGPWINTHDKFLLDDDGYFWYAGRTDDMMKVSGQAVWPTDVEGVLIKHPAVLETGVVGALDADGLTRPVAYVVLKDGRVAAGDLARELQQFVKQQTAPHKYPRAVVFVDELPKTATGKIKRFRLRERAAAENPLQAK